MRQLRNPHPGEILKEEFLNEIGISQNQLAQAIGVPGNRIHAIVNGTRDITADTDLRLCKFFGLSNGYWLRAQADAARFSTIEALLFLLEFFGLNETRDALRLQFELHVYASLRARGHKADALAFLAESPIATAFAGLIAQLDVRRPL